MQEIEPINDKAPYDPLTFKFMLQLAAPHTWAASIFPVLIAVAIAWTRTGVASFIMAVVLLLICILMQASANTFNDYFDFLKGTDSDSDNVEADDNTLIVNNIDPNSVLLFAIIQLVLAFALGAYVIWSVGWLVLIIAVVGAAVVIFYSAGKTPISYLPVGELVIGFVMGDLILFASYYALTGLADLFCFLWGIPLLIGIGLILMTNNTCDIEKDERANRRTYPVLAGRAKTRRLYHRLVAVWIIALFLDVAVFFVQGLVVAIFMLVASIALLKPLLRNPLVSKSRIAAMSQIVSLNIVFGAFYAAAILASGYAVVL